MPVDRKQSVSIAPDSERVPRRRSSVLPPGMSLDKAMVRRRSTVYSLNLNRRKSKIPEMTEEQRRHLARDRFRRAVFKVKAMIRFGLPLRAPKKEETKEKDKKHLRYSRVTAPNFSRALSTMVIDKMKDLELPRYKFVCNIMIGENKGQCFQYASRSVWNTATDNMATAEMKTAIFFAVATVHAVYLE
ncbi:hypothetical protein LSH36_4g00006 [Paralvinella palmiformis]|uniref:Uncharacterized protein n=1 Tax=Paralvinella palmiformis TaxID=53620 RepID=A0AAD9KGG7_9ANNE|nr:hypothetical protein LSH36_4g00006 [Paralvinella palmiformis]